MTQHTPPRNNDYAPFNSRCAGAFTLIELVIVIAIVSITAAIAIPRLSGASTRYRVDSAVQQVIADINVTAAMANRASAAHSIQFDAAAETYTLVGQPSLNDPAVDQAVNLSREPYKVNLLRVSIGGGSQLNVSGFGLIADSGQITLAAGTQGRRIIFTQGSSSVQIVDLTLAEPTNDEDIDVESSGTPRTVDVKGVADTLLRSLL